MRDGRWMLRAGCIGLGLLLVVVVVGLRRPALLSYFPEPAPAASSGQPDWQQRQRQAREAEDRVRELLADQRRHERLREKLLLTPECRFWWQQDQHHPTARTVEQRHRYCEP